MERFTKVRTALSKYEKFSRGNDELLFVPMVGLAFLVKDTALIGIVLVFILMILEDIFERTVDMYLFVWLVAFMALCSDIFRFTAYFVGGWVFFQMIYMLSAKVMTFDDFTEIREKYEWNICPLAFLPSIGIAIVGWECVKWYFGFSIIELPLRDWAGSIILFLIVGFLAAQGYERVITVRAESRSMEIFHGFGDGDVWVCAAWLAFMGVEDFFVVFVLATALQLIFYAGIFLYRKGRGKINE